MARFKRYNKSRRYGKKNYKKKGKRTKKIVKYGVSRGGIRL